MQEIDPETIAALASRAKKEPGAFGKLYDLFVQPVYRYLYHRVGSRCDAEDLTSKTFIAAYEAMPDYQEEGRFAAWLFRIARFKLVDHYRRKEPGLSLDKVDHRIQEDEDKVGRLIRDEELERLMALIRALNDEEQELIYLRFVFGFTYGEMGEFLDKSADAVKKSIYRLLERLKYQME